MLAIVQIVNEVKVEVGGGVKEIKVSVSAEGLGESRSVNLGVKLNFKHGNHLKCQSGCVGEI